MRFDIRYTSFKEPEPWKHLPRVLRRRLHGSYYLWWRIEIMTPTSSFPVWAAMVVYLYSKFIRIRLPQCTLQNVNFLASVEGRMYSALQQFLAARSINKLRRQLLWEIGRLDAGNQRLKILPTIDQLSPTYSEAYMEACPLKVCILPGSFGSRK